MKSCNAFTTGRRSGVLAVLSLGVLLFSCADIDFTAECEDCPDDAGFTPRTSPDGLLEFLAEAYERENIDAYSEALSDFFEFEFTDDIADSLGLPRESPWWGKMEDVNSTRNMFDDPDVTVIKLLLEYRIGQDWEDCSRRFIRGDPPDTTFINALCKTFEPDIRVYMEEPGAEERVLWVNDSLVDIMITPDPHEEGLWVVLRIAEERRWPLRVGQNDASACTTPTLVAAVDGSSWGSIKALFRE
jgi:hypothetical protein